MKNIHHSYFSRIYVAVILQHSAVLRSQWLERPDLTWLTPVVSMLSLQDIKKAKSGQQCCLWTKFWCYWVDFFRANTRNGLELQSDCPSEELPGQLDKLVQTPEIPKVTLNWQYCTEKRKNKSMQRCFYSNHYVGLQIQNKRPQRQLDTHWGSEEVQAPSTKNILTTMKLKLMLLILMILCFFQSHKKLAFTLICSTALTTAKQISFKIPTLFLSTFKWYS